MSSFQFNCFQTSLLNSKEVAESNDLQSLCLDQKKNFHSTYHYNSKLKSYVSAGMLRVIQLEEMIWRGWTKLLGSNLQGWL